MIKKLVSAALLVCMALALAACQSGTMVTAPPGGTATAAVGDIVRTGQLDIRAKGVQSVASYGSYAARAEEQLIDVTVTLHNISDADVTLYDTDFQLQWGADGFADPFVNTGGRTMAPLETVLAPGDKAEYHYVYPVLRQVTDFSLVYVEVGTEGETDDTIYYINFTV